MQQVNQNGAFWTTLGLLDLLKASPHGRVVNTASIQGVRASYATAKGGVVNMTRALALDLAAHGILVNCILPRLRRYAHGIVA